MKNKKIDELSVILQSMTKLTARIIWVCKLRELLTGIFASNLGMAWASTLVLYVFTGDMLCLKLFFGVIALGLMFYFIVMLLETIGKRRRDNYINSLDMASMDKPFTTDINNMFFPEEEPVKYIVTDKNDPMYKKILFLYPIYGRLNQNKTITFFKKNQIEPVTDKK